MTQEALLQEIKHIQALAERGERGERDSARALLARLMEKYSLTEADLENERVETAWFTYHDELERRILCQIIYGKTVFRVRWDIHQQEAEKAGRGLYGGGKTGNRGEPRLFL